MSRKSLPMNTDGTDGTQGFAPNYSGNAISGVHNTSSFDVEAGTHSALKGVKLSQLPVNNNSIQKS